ncbi:MAG TPA: hypothetical protein VFG47_20610, partial [Geminicoccaceae bacterium]|nr:hypothetical protein [Geminicoccaceae bacterium]
ARRARWDGRRRMALALGLLDDPRLDVLLTGAGPLAELPAVMPGLASAPGATLCHVVTYP